jgi:signal transduction histidine kinase/ligand-binding sensor domain-containing protein/DNA-binding response OmpR family regulator
MKTETNNPATILVVDDSFVLRFMGSKRESLRGILTLLLAAVPFLSAHAEGGGRESNSAPAQVSQTSVSAVGGDALSASRPLRFTHLTTEDGLSQGNIHGILQDRQGFMWFATGYGLNRFDGYSFIVYKHNPDDSTSLSANGVLDLLEDDRGYLWITTYNGGINRFDPTTERFTRYRHDSKNPNSISSDRVESVIQDSRGYLWFGTGDNGLDRFDPATQTFTHYRNDNENQFVGRITDVIEDSQGDVWFVGDRGLHHVNPKTGQITRPAATVDYRADSICEDKMGNLWLLTWAPIVGLVKYDRKAERLKEYPLGAGAFGLFTADLLDDGEHGFWVPSSLGLYYFDRQTEHFTRVFRHDETDPDSLNNNHVVSIYKDRSGLLWLGTESEGLNLLNFQQEQFGYYRHDPANPNSLSPGRVSAIFCDPDDILWVGFYPRALDRFDRSTGQIAHFAPNPDNENALGKGNDVDSIYRDAQGYVWVGGWGSGLVRFDERNGQFKHYPPNPDDPNSLISDAIIAIHEDRSGNLWVGQSVGVSRLDRATGKFTNYLPKPGDPTSLGDASVQGIYQDRSGGLWLGTWGGVLSRFDYQTETFLNYTPDSRDPHKLYGGLICAIHEDQTRTLWVGASDGLYRFNRKNETFTRYTENQGLPSSNIRGILEDKAGNLWLSTQNGLSRFNPQTETFRNYDASDGLQGKDFSSGCYAQGQRGEMFFGGSKGLNAFFPENIRDNPFVPPVVLTDFQLFNKPVAIGKDSPLKKAINVADQITLRYDQEVFRLKFAALSFAQPQENRYAYKLEGFDHDWRYTGANDRSATYTRLAPGSYTFRVKASNNDGVWNEQGTSIKITVLPPWWATWWFRSAATASLLGMAFAGYRRRVRAITRRATALELEVAQRTRSLSERTEELASTNAELIAAKEAAEAASRAKSEFLSSMSHELRTPLNAILGYTQILGQQDNLTSRQHQQVDVMHASGEHLLMLISDILDLSRIEARRLELVEAPFRLPQLLEQTIEITKVKADQKHLALLYEADLTLPECVRGDERRVRQILLNLLANAVKFTPQGSVTLRVKYDQTNGGSLHCEVADTGIGIASDKLEAIFEPFIQISPDAQGREGVGLGLTITRRLATLMGGVVTVESRSGQGSTFRLSVPLPPATPLEKVAELSPRQIRGYRGTRKQVLVADDNPTNVGLLVAILEPLGFEVLTARNGREALRQALERPPDLVLLDLVMPEMDGLETVRQMRQHTELDATRIVGVSASVTGSERKQAFTAACDGFLGKPIQVRELLQTIGRLLQLEWDIAPTDTTVVPAGDVSLTATAVPPPAVLAALRQTVERGEFGELERLLKEQAADAAYAGFCQQMRRLAARYDDEGIVAYLNRLGKAPDENGNK